MLQYSVWCTGNF